MKTTSYKRPPRKELKPHPTVERCLNCGKRMYHRKNAHTGKYDAYTWYCDCMPDDMSVSIG